MKTMTLSDFLTNEQIEQIKDIWLKQKMPAKTICEKVIRPNIAEICRRLGVSEDPFYLAHCCMYILNEAGQRTASAAVCRVCGDVLTDDPHLCAPCKARIVKAGAFIKSQVEAGAVEWSCQNGHFGLIAASLEFAKKWVASGGKGTIYTMPEGECPVCGVRPS